MLADVPNFVADERFNAVAVFALSTLNVDPGISLFNSADGSTIDDLANAAIPTLVIGAVEDTTSPLESNTVPVWNTVQCKANEFVGDFRDGYIDFGWDDFACTLGLVDQLSGTRRRHPPCRRPPSCAPFSRHAALQRPSAPCCRW